MYLFAGIMTSPVYRVRRVLTAIRHALFLGLATAILSPAHATSYLEDLRARTPVLPANELRAVWVVRHALNSQEDIDRAIDYAVRARFHIVFAQVRGRGDAFYRSELEPAPTSLRQPIDTFDPLAYLVERAHEEGIAVHAWVNVFYVWSDFEESPPPKHIVSAHPEWLVADREGVRMDELPVLEWQRRGLEGYYASPGNREARQHTASVVADIVSRYAVDGVHLDYIRYPGWDFDFSAGERTRFQLRYGIDPLPRRSGSDDMRVLGPDGAQLIDSLMTEWRVAQVDSMVRMIRSTVDTLPLSAAVVPDFVTARRDKGQDWLSWVQRGDVDFVVPMAYTYEPAELRSRIALIQRSIGNERFLVGLPVFEGRTQFLGYSVSLLRRDGVLGYALFSYNALEEERFSLQFLQRVFLQAYDE